VDPAALAVPLDPMPSFLSASDRSFLAASPLLADGHAEAHALHSRLPQLQASVTAQVQGGENVWLERNPG